MTKKDNNLEEQKQSGKGTGTKSRNLFKDTISRALLENDSKRLRALIEKAITLAEHVGPDKIGDFMTILKFLADRVDGRASQSIEITDSVELPSAGQFKIVRLEPPSNE